MIARYMPNRTGIWTSIGRPGGEGRDLVLALEGLGLFHHLLTADLVLLALVLVLNLAHLGLDGLHGARGSDLLEEQRDDGDAHQDGEQHDGQDPRDAGAGGHSNEHQEVMDPRCLTKQSCCLL